MTILKTFSLSAATTRDPNTWLNLSGCHLRMASLMRALGLPLSLASGPNITSSIASLGVSVSKGMSLALILDRLNNSAYFLCATLSFFGGGGSFSGSLFSLKALSCDVGFLAEED